MHRAVILLACACAAYAQVDISTEPYLQDARDVKDSEEVEQPSAAPAGVLNWPPPNYNTHLHNTDKTIDKIINIEAFHAKNDSNFRYVVATYVIYALAEAVQKDGWKAYNDTYKKLVKENMQYAMFDPTRAAQALKCYFMYPTQDAIKHVREIMNSFPVNFICKSQPEWCDIATWTVLYKAGTISDIASSYTLERAGTASALFLKDYAHTLEAVSNLNVYRYLSFGQDDLRPLVSDLATLLKKIKNFRLLGCMDNYNDPIDE